MLNQNEIQSVEQSSLLFKKIKSEINKNNIYIYSVEEWLEISLLQYESQYETTKIYNTKSLLSSFKILFYDNLDNLGIKKTEYNKKREEFSILMEEIKEALLTDDLSSLSHEDKLKKEECYIYLPRNQILNNSSNLKKSLDINNLSNLSIKLEDYLYTTVVYSPFVSSLSNPKGVDFNNKGSINCFVNKKTGDVIPDYYSIKELNDTTWSKEELLNNPVLSKSPLNLKLNMALSLLSSRYHKDIKYYKSPLIESKKALKLSIDYPYFPASNNIDSYLYSFLSSGDSIFTIKTTKPVLSFQSAIYHIEGEPKIVFNTPKEELLPETVFSYIELFNKEEKLYKVKDGDVSIKINNEFLSLYDIKVLKKVSNKINRYKLTLLPKNNNFQKDILRLPYVVSELEYKDKTFKEEIEKKYYILDKEELLISENLEGNFFKSLNELNSEEMVNDYYKILISQIPKHVQDKIQKLNKIARTSLLKTKNLDINAISVI